MTEENEFNAYADARFGDYKVTPELGWTYDECASDVLGECFYPAIRLSFGTTHLICMLPTHLEEVVDVEFDGLDYVALHRPYEPDSFGLTKKEAIENCIAKLTRDRDSSELRRSRAVAHLEQL